VIIISGVLRWIGYFVFKHNVRVPSEIPLRWGDLIPFRQEMRLTRKLQEWMGKDSDSVD
jgi:hypothetical protein